MKFIATPYHHNLLKDYERLSCFHEAILKFANGVVYDIGAGSGVLSYFAAPSSRIVFAIEKEEEVASYATRNLKSFPNVKVINEDALSYDFPLKADLIICEMLDTALIDEEQVPVMNRALQSLKKGGRVIPLGVINAVEAVKMDSMNIIYECNGTEYKKRGRLTVYDRIRFTEVVDEKVDYTLKIPAIGKVNGIKITTFTLLTEDIIAGPTPMMNPPLLIPMEEIEEKGEYTLKLRLSYKMGGGLNTIKLKIRDII